MSNLLCALFITFAHADTLPLAEIQMFLNYSGRNHYALKIVSTPENPVSAFYVHIPENASSSTTAACYYGDLKAAAHLFLRMVHVYNAEYRRNVKAAIEQDLDGDSLRVFEIDEAGRKQIWFPKLSRCTRASTENERWPKP